MIKFSKEATMIEIPTDSILIKNIAQFFSRNIIVLIFLCLSIVSVLSFYAYYNNGLGLAYNDARSHLDIGRRVVEGLKPGLAQLGSVWLPLPHLLMVPTIWNDFMWHSGLSGAIISMISYVYTSLLIYLFLEKIGASVGARLLAVILFAANLNILYLQSTAMTELLLITTMTAGAYELLLWIKLERIPNLLKAAFWIMLSTLNRYDGWFLFVFSVILIGIYVWRSKGYKTMEGTILLFCTLGGLGIALWLLWNALIFNDPLYFAFGPYSARAQQIQLEEAGILATKGNVWFSLKVYFYALAYNSNAYLSVLGLFGAILLWFDQTINPKIKLITTALFAPLLFNILALYLGHSVLFIQGLSGDTWFNVRYGIMMMPSIAIFTGYLFHRLPSLRIVLLGTIAFVTFFSFSGFDAVTIDDARVGSSQKNVTEVSGWLAKNTKAKKGFILISAASHDAIIFSSGLPMSRFIHEGTGLYWENATLLPDRWARWIIMRTNDDNDQTFRLIKNKPGLKHYLLVGHYPFADIYELKEEYLPLLETKPIIKNQK